MDSFQLNTESEAPQTEQGRKADAVKVKAVSELVASASRLALRSGAILAQVTNIMTGANAAAGRLTDNILLLARSLVNQAGAMAGRDEIAHYRATAADLRSIALRATRAALDVHALMGGPAEPWRCQQRRPRDGEMTMEEVLHCMLHLRTQIDAVAAWGRQQDSEFYRIQHAVARLQDVVGHNAALVTQAVAAADALQWQAMSALRMVERSTREKDSN
jgi:hypothetical protein